MTFAVVYLISYRLFLQIAVRLTVYAEILYNLLFKNIQLSQAISFILQYNRSICCSYTILCRTLTCQRTLYVNCLYVGVKL